MDGDNGMTIIEFVYSLNDGGAETLVKEYAIRLHSLGHEVKIVTIYPTVGTANSESVIKIGVDYSTIYPKRSYLYRILNKINNEKRISKRLLRIIKDFQPDVIHIHTPLLKYLAPIRDKLEGIRLFFTCHTIPQRYYDNVSERDALHLLVEKNQLLIIALHQEMAKEIKELFNTESVVVLHNGIDTNRFLVAKNNRNIMREKLSIPSNAFVVGHIGRFIDVKNHAFLLEIFSELRKTNQNALLLLIGDGELQDTVKQKAHELSIDEYVIILSHQTNIPDLLSAMDVFVFPSKYEGMPITVIEAQVSGIKCIISDRINTECIISNRTTQLSIDLPATAWCKAILSEYNDEPSIKIETIDIDIIINKLLRLYNGLELRDI